MSTPAEHAELFKSPWVADPGLLEQSMREARVSDRYTAELAAWCAEIHEHLRELAGALGIELLLMGGNGASLRFDAVEQRGSRDNDYLTAATPENIGRLMDSLGQRFLALGELMQPRPFEPKRPVRALPLKTYVVPVPLLLNHGNSTNNEVKIEFHFERRLPPAQTVTGTLGPAATPSITAALPELPYQVGIKLMTLASDPVGIDESTRAAAVPRQMYDLDLLLAGLEQHQWAALAEYTRERYAEECELWDTEVQADEPFTGIRTRLERWGDCLDESATRWHVIRAAQQSGLRRAVHLRSWGWRARAYRLIIVAEALRLGDDGWDVWKTAREAAAQVPVSSARSFRPALAQLAGVPVGQLPVELSDFVWPALLAGDEDLPGHVARAAELLATV